MLQLRQFFLFKQHHMADSSFFHPIIAEWARDYCSVKIISINNLVKKAAVDCEHTTAFMFIDREFYKSFGVWVCDRNHLNEYCCPHIIPPLFVHNLIGRMVQMVHGQPLCRVQRHTQCSPAHFLL